MHLAGEKPKSATGGVGRGRGEIWVLSSTDGAKGGREARASKSYV